MRPGSHSSRRVVKTSTTWAEIHERRWAWANDAFDSFRQSLSPSERDHFPDNRQEVRSVLYGPSQTGKSTLLLRLLGVREGTAFGEVEDVLRGHRGYGRSATSVPSQYRWSHDSDSWEVVADDVVRPEVDGSAVAGYLAEIRRLVEAGLYSAEGRPLEIGVPTKYRDVRAGESWQRVIDLPGTNPRHQAERDHAVAVARRYLASAHVVILVSRADDMTSLRPSHLEHEMPPLASWLHAPQRFRIVLTHAVSSRSSQQWFQENQPSISEFRSMVSQQLTETLSLNGAQDAVPVELVFPVEYGDSWRALAATRPDLHARAGPVVDGLFAELSAGLYGRDPDQMRLLTALRAGPILSATVERKAKQLRKQRDRCYARVTRRQELSSKLRNRAKAAHDEACLAELHARDVRRCLELTSLITVADIELADDKPTTGDAARFLNSDARARFIAESEAAWLRWATAGVSERIFAAHPKTLMVSSIDQLAGDAFDKHVSCCRNCRNPAPWPPTAWFADPPQRCWERHTKGIPTAQFAISALLQQQAAERVAPALEQADAGAAIARSKREEWRGRVKAAAKRLSAARASLNEAERGLADIAQEHAESKARAQELERQLDEQWRAQDASLWREFAQARNSNDRGFLTAAILLHHRMRDELYAGKTS